MGDQLGLLLEKLERIESAVGELLKQRAVKEWYSTAEVAAIVGKAEYTVREWCRQGRVAAEKMENGRGWIVPHAELERVRNHGPLPIPKHEPHRVLDRRRK